LAEWLADEPQELSPERRLEMKRMRLLLPEKPAVLLEHLARARSRV
jgi:hypothetical protein